MTQRSPAVVFILGCITFGIYPLIWLINTKEEMNAQGAEIPTGWFLIIPILNLLWLWKWSQGVEKVTRQGTGAAIAFLMIWFAGPIGMAVVQSSFNKLQLGPGA